MFKNVPVKTFGQDPETGNTRFTIGDSQITSGTTDDKSYPLGSHFTSFGKDHGHHVTGIFEPGGKLLDIKRH